MFVEVWEWARACAGRCVRVAVVKTVTERVPRRMYSGAFGAVEQDCIF